jgi:hypothetical protein
VGPQAPARHPHRPARPAGGQQRGARAELGRGTIAEGVGAFSPLLSFDTGLGEL